MRDADGALCRPPRRSPPPGIEPVELAEKEGLALINGTDGMLGMLVLAAADLRRAAPHRRHRRRDERRGAARHRRASSPPTCRRCARTPARRPVPRNLRRAAGRLARSWPATAARTAPGCRTPTRCAARRRCTAPSATPSPTPRRSPAASWPAPIDNPVVTLDGRVESQRQLPRRAGRLRARLPGHRRRRPGLDQRAAHRPVPRPGAQRTGCRRSSPTTPASTAAT